jgi:hypothetical protein
VTVGEATCGRMLLAAGTETYKHGDGFAVGLEDLHVVPEELQSIVSSLSELGYVTPRQSLPYLLDPKLQELRNAIRTAATTAPVIILYLTGHGLNRENSPFYILTSDSDEKRLEETALEPRQLLSLLLRREHGTPTPQQPQVLVILDCCFSGTGSLEMLWESLRAIGNPNVWVMASAGREWAAQGLFVQALTEVLKNADVGRSSQYIPLDLITGRVNAALTESPDGQQARVIPPRGETVGVPPFFPNSHYVPGVAGLTVEDQVWVSRLRGSPESGTTTGFYVSGSTGRVRAVEDMAAWMHRPTDRGLSVITGSPGSGKSTILALPTLLSDVSGKQALLQGAPKGSLLAKAADLFAGLSVIGLNVRGMDPYQVTDAVAEHIGRTATSPFDLLHDLEPGDNEERTRRIFVIDALDEARDPRRLLLDLVLPLSQRPNIKVLLGTRRHLLPPPDLINLLIDLDADAYRDPKALIQYVRQLLLGTNEPDLSTPYRRAPKFKVALVAEAIAAKATSTASAFGQAESFLLAQLLARVVRSREYVLNTAAANLTKQLPADVGAAFDEDLSRMGKREPVVRVLLTALAWAKGSGLPWENIWLPVAQALFTPTPSCAAPPSTDDLRWLLNNAGGYIVEDLDLGQRSSFRPFHDLLAAHLRDKVVPQNHSSELDLIDAGEERNRQIEGSITQALVATVPTNTAGLPEWEFSHPYLRTYLAQHAYAAGPAVLGRLITNLDYLIFADSTTLVPLIRYVDPSTQPVARAYLAALPAFSDDLSENAAVLQEAVVAEPDRPATHQCVRPTYRTLRTRIGRADFPLRGASHARVICSVASAGQTLLASGDTEGVMQVWNPLTGDLSGSSLGHQTNHVRSLAFGTKKGGEILLASAGTDQVIRLWNPLTFEAVGDPLAGHEGCVFSAAFGTTKDDQLILASAGTDKTVRIWDPLTGNSIGTPLTGHTGQIRTVTFGTAANGQLILASAGTDKTIRIWDPLTGNSIGTPLTGHTGPIRAIALGTAANGQLILASAGTDKTIRIWDPLTGNSIGKTLTGHTGEVDSVAFGSSEGGRLTLASGSWDKTVRFWCPSESTALKTIRRRTPVVGLTYIGSTLAVAEKNGIAIIEP